MKHLLKKYIQSCTYHLKISVIFVFTVSNLFIPANISFARMDSSPLLGLPSPGTMVKPTQSFNPALVRGINVYPSDPLKFDFIVDKGDFDVSQDSFDNEANKLIKYFLVALTIPEEEMWVNLSPYEKNRIIPKNFGHTEMGRDLLAQDYLLKQLSSSLTHPDETLGKEFWERIRTKVKEQFNTTDIPMSTFNKIWIVPEMAKVYEHQKGAFVLDSRLKVMLEEDYIALEMNMDNEEHGAKGIEISKANRERIITDIQNEIIRQVILPAIEKEVNQGKTFAPLRQIYHSVILASWYKSTLKDSLLGREYVDQAKTTGIESSDNKINQKIYDRYVAAFQKGVFDLIREDMNSDTNEVIPRKYFSGGFDLTRVKQSRISVTDGDVLSEFAMMAKDMEKSNTAILIQWKADTNTVEGDVDFAMGAAQKRLEVVMRDVEDLRVAPDQKGSYKLIFDSAYQTMELVGSTEGSFNRFREDRLQKLGGFEEGFIAFTIDGKPQGENGEGRMLRDGAKASREGKGQVVEGIYLNHQQKALENGQVDWDVDNMRQKYHQFLIAKVKEEYDEALEMLEAGDIDTAQRHMANMLEALITIGNISGFDLNTGRDMDAAMVSGNNKSTDLALITEVVIEREVDKKLSRKKYKLKRDQMTPLTGLGLRSVIVVDDDEDHRLLMEMSLKRKNAKIKFNNDSGVEFDDGNSVLDVLKSIQKSGKYLDVEIDAIITDYQMSQQGRRGINGDQLIVEIRKLGYHGPIILNTFDEEALVKRGEIRPAEEKGQYRLTKKGISKYGLNTFVISKSIEASVFVDDLFATFEAASDAAMKAAVQYGGIDMNPTGINMDVHKNGIGFDAPFHPQELNIDIKYITPNIINITPAKNLLQMLGFKHEGDGNLESGEPDMLAFDYGK